MFSHQTELHDLRAENERLTQVRDMHGETIQTLHSHVKEALELLGVDVSVAGYIPDSWTLREQCHRAAKERDTARCELAEMRERVKQVCEYLERHTILPYADLAEIAALLNEKGAE